MNECFSTAITETPLFMLGVLAGLLLHFLIKVVSIVLDYINAIIQPLIMELCMLGNLRVRIFGINIVFINPLLARQVRLRLKSL
jgi:hypothetical protein